MRPAQVAAVAREILARRGDRVRAVHQDGLLGYRIALEGPTGRGDLVLDLDPGFPRVHLAKARPAPAAPSAFAAALRRHLVGARIADACAVEGERALRLVFGRGDDSFTLWFEGFGRGANLYLVDAEDRVLLTPRGEVAKDRDARVGATFEPVPARIEDAPEEETGGSDAVAAAAEAHRKADALRRLEVQVRRTLKQRLARAERAVASLEAMAERGRREEEHRRRGEDLLSRIHLVDPREKPAEEVDRCFNLARRARRATEEAAARMPEAERALREAQQALTAAEGAEPEALAELARSLRIAPRVRRAGKAPPTRALGWREYRSAESWPILVGKDAKGNDRLTLHKARPSDLFLHVRGATGSHVIVPTPRGKTVPRDTLLEAAELAVWFSDRRGAGVAEVDHTPRRYVRKPRKAPPGLVVVERARTLTIRPNEARRRSVLSRRQEPRGGGEPAAK